MQSHATYFLARCCCCYHSCKNINSIPYQRLIFIISTLMFISSFILFTFSTFLVVALFQSVGGGQTYIYFAFCLLSVVGLALLIICIIGMRGSHLASLELLVIYFWGITLFIAPLILGSVVCFIFLINLRPWVNHQWDLDGFKDIRAFFCREGTQNTLCVHPSFNLPSFNATGWCIETYNSTSCAEVRENGINSFITLGRMFFNSVAGIALAHILEIFVSMIVCYNILTLPVLSQSMNEYINYLLLISIGGTFGLGQYVWWIRDYDMPHRWIPPLFFALGGLQCLLVPFGILAGRMKSQAMLAAYIAFSVLTLGGVALVGTSCLVYSSIMGEIVHYNSQELAEIVCDRDFTGCCCCHASGIQLEDRCPSWDSPDIIRFLSNDMLIAGTAAILSTIYVFGAIFVAEVVRRNLRNYKCEYI